ncbi:hypothetical protein TgHK011_004299 [Trichoderma gracile]|nr:hypothetical protein TgHK011_004299 [Trichoderma gracile]
MHWAGQGRRQALTESGRHSVVPDDKQRVQRATPGRLRCGRKREVPYTQSMPCIMYLYHYAYLIPLLQGYRDCTFRRGRNKWKHVTSTHSPLQLDSHSWKGGVGPRDGLWELGMAKVGKASRPQHQVTQGRPHQERGASDAIIHTPCSRGRTQTRRPTLSTLLAQPAGVATDRIHVAFTPITRMCSPADYAQLCASRDKLTHTRAPALTP